MTDFLHHSRLVRYRCPQGAAPVGSLVNIEADCFLPEGTQVFLRLWQEAKSEVLLPMEREGSRCFCAVTLPEAPCLLWYFFVLHTPDGHTFYYGADSGEGAFFEHEPPAYQITVYDGAFKTPEIWKQGVCYQIFPDRFRRSSWEDFRARTQYHLNLGRLVRIHDRWTDRPSAAPAAGQSCYSPNDFFGGDLRGITEKLPYLFELGVTYLYLNPIFESESNHRYNTADYFKIDPILGTEDDFIKLCAEGKKRGIRVILDGVFSHTGSDSRYFNRAHRYDTFGACQGKDSPYYPWYRFSRYPDKYDCWWGFPTLPNVSELTPSYVEFITGENGVLAYWMRRGASGWRLDVADELPDEFIRLVRARIKKENENGVLLGEVWEDCSCKFAGSDRRDYVDGDVLDGAMNYPFAKAAVSFLTGRTTAFQLQNALGTLREHYPKPFFDACMNLLSSHDDVRLLYQLAGAPARTALSRAEQEKYAPSAEELLLAHRRTALAFALQCALPGVPSLYYGDEAGMPGMSDPFNRAPYPWDREETDILTYARSFFPLRTRCRALTSGLCRTGALKSDVFAVVRYLPESGEAALLLINRADRFIDVTLSPESLPEGPDGAIPVPFSGAYRDAVTGEIVLLTDALRASLPPVSAKLLIKGEM